MAGRVTALPVLEGARVRAGQLLAVFDAPEARQGLAAARSELAASELALGVAKRQHERMEALRAAGVVADREREMADSEHRGAEARLAAARAQVDQLDAATRVRAPFAGVVVRRHLDVGADVGAGAPIVDVRSEGPVEVVVPVPETAVPLLANATLSAQSGDGPWLPVRLRRIDGMTDYVSRTRTARLAFTDLGKSLEAGTYARVRIEPAAGAARVAIAAAAAAGTSVPVASLVRRGGLAGVYVVDDGRAVLRWLKLGRTAGDRAEVIGGLLPGDAVILAPAGLSDGAPVKVKP
jgi:RND family efflux transporter MFP subunit